MFKTDFVNSWTQVPHCPGCNQQFKLYSKCDPASSRRPVILPCSHLICEQCTRNTPQLTCSVCKQVTKHNPKRNTFLEFDVQIYLFGHMSFLKNNFQIILNKHEFELKFGKKAPISPAASLSPSQQLLNGLLTEKKLNCGECMTVQTDRLCSQCNEAYCVPCFKKVHASSRTLKRHELVRIDRQLGKAVGAELRMCQRHRDQELNNYCQQCRQAVCDECKTDFHSRHKVSSLVLENRKTLPKLRELSETLKMAKNVVEKSQKESNKEAGEKIKKNAEIAVQEIFQHFIAQQSLLQQAEKKAMLEVKSRANHAIVQLNNANSLLNDSYNKIEEALARINHFCTEVPKHANLPQMVEEVNSMLEHIPCSVDLQDIDNMFRFQHSSTIPTFNFPNGPFKPNLTSFNGFPSENYRRIKPTPNKRNDSNMSAINTKRSNILHPSNVNSLVLFGNQSLNDTNYSVRLSCRSTKKKDHFKEHTLDDQLVRVSHINNPNQLYVQNFDFITMSSTFMDTCKKESNYAARPNCIEVNELYLVLQLKVWYRAEVVRQLDEDLFLMCFVDYGRTEEIDTDRIRCISKDLASRPFGARQCSIYSIKPGGNAWTAEANQLMSEIIANEPVSMITLTESEDGVRLVDLIAQHRKYPTSVRDSLIGLGYAVADIPNCSALMKASKAMHTLKQKRFLNEQKSFKRTPVQFINVDVKVTSIVSPIQFYVMRDISAAKLAKLTVQMQAAYSAVSHDPIYVPHPDMVCAVYVQDLWQRARITRHCETNTSEFEVLLVDCGTSRRIHWRHIRELDDQFLFDPEGAIYCSMAKIRPLPDNNGVWSQDAISTFRRATHQARIHAEFLDVSDGRHDVILYQMNKDKVPVNINEMLVKRGFALGDGFSTPVLFEQADYINPVESDSRDVTISNRSVQSESVELRTRVKLVHIGSPGEFYVMLTKHISGVEQMNLMIQEHMFGVKKMVPQTNWRTGDLCLINIALPNDVNGRCWYRGRIQSINYAEDEFEVFLRDRGLVSVVSHEKLESIPEKFKTVSDGATLCHMACVQPTNERKKWPSVSCEQLNKIVTEFEGLGVSLQGPRKNNSIAIVLWGLSSDSSDPLQNTVHRWLNINKILVQKGLAQMFEPFNTLTEKYTESKKLDELLLADGGDQFDSWLANLFRADTQKTKNRSKATVENMVYELHSKTSHLNADFSLNGSWQPPILIDKTIFTAMVTYVDNNGIIYLHDYAEQEVMDQIQKVVNERCKYNSVRVQPGVNTSWAPNDSCLAKFHLDGLFHRAVLLSIDQTLGVASVQFVDYGNVENCPMFDILPPGTLLANIPIQARKYCLANLRPIANAEEHWPRDTLDYLHAQVVGKVSAITRCNYDEAEVAATKITSCRIVSNGIRINDLLVERNMAYYDEHHIIEEVIDIRNDVMQIRNPDYEGFQSFQVAKEETAPKKSPYKSLSAPTMEKKKKKKQHKPASAAKEHDFEPGYMDYDKYADLFSKMSDQENGAIALKNNDEDLEVEFCTKHMIRDYDFLTVDECDSDTDVSEADLTSSTIFEPDDTSTQLSTSTNLLHWSRRYPFTNFRTINLDVDSTFVGQAMLVPDAVHLWIHPDDSPLKTIWDNMAREIATHSRILCDQIQQGLLCLAVFKDDSQLYRAIVQHFDGILDEVTIVYIDYMNVAVVRSRDIFMCPKELVTTPLMNVLVRLHGVSVNPRLRDFDVKQRLAQLLQDVHVNVRVVRKTSFITEVQLFDLVDKNHSTMDSRSSLSEQNLVYQDMINEKFFILTKKRR